MIAPTRINDQAVIDGIRRWLDQVVVQFNLCPFAQRELINDRVRFSVSAANSDEQLLADLREELRVLNLESSIATSLLIHPDVLNDFLDYNQFLDRVDALLLEENLDGVYQVASFHPHYQFSGTAPEDAENYTNRSPFPILHLLREDDVSLAVDGYPDADLIPQRNVKRLQEIGAERLCVLLEACKG